MLDKAVRAQVQAQRRPNGCNSTWGSTDATAAPNGDRYCEEKFVQKYIPTIGVDYGVKPVKLGDYEVSSVRDHND